MLQSYLSLAVRSREHQATTNPLDGRAHADIPSNGDDFPTNVSPEMLLSRAESYIAHALRAGSELPLARLVKGDCLVLRRQFQVKTISCHNLLLSGAVSASRNFAASPVAILLGGMGVFLVGFYRRIAFLVTIPAASARGRDTMFGSGGENHTATKQEWRRVLVGVNPSCSCSPFNTDVPFVWSALRQNKSDIRMKPFRYLDSCCIWQSGGIAV